MPKSYHMKESKRWSEIRILVMLGADTESAELLHLVETSVK